MNHEDTVKLLTLVKGNWYRQPTDDLTIQMWREILGEMTDVREAWEAAMDFVRAGAEEPPAPGMIYRAAMELAKRREEQERRRRKSIEEPPPNDEERQRMKQKFGDLVGRLARSVAAVRVVAEAETAVGVIQTAATRSVSTQIDPDTERAQEIILARRREKLRVRKQSEDAAIAADNKPIWSGEYGDADG